MSEICIIVLEGATEIERGLAEEIAQTLTIVLDARNQRLERVFAVTDIVDSLVKYRDEFIVDGLK